MAHTHPLTRYFTMPALAGLLITLAACSQGAQAGPARPVVVELFTSQGCSSCPPANATLNQLADRKDVLALSFGVIYWDYLGWKDTFASQANTQRQYDYAKGLHHEGVYTPQMVIDGRKDTTGQSLSQVEPLIKSAKNSNDGPALTLSADKVTIAAAPQKIAQVWLVHYDPRIVQVPINRGENAGRTLPHRNVVHELVKLGTYSGQAAKFSLPKSKVPGLKTAVLVQAGTGGAIVSAATN
ncbi:MAG: DUF1223 domain-containing protein [Asticcacaulis sp.]